MQKLHIKKATKKHLPDLQQISRQTFFETFRDTNTSENLEKYLETNFNAQKLSAEIDTLGSQFFLAYGGDEVVGYLKINTGDAQTEFQKNDEFEVERIYVIKAYWGKEVGQTLLDHALRIALKRNFRLVWLGVWEKNYRAIRFYEKNGFVAFDQHYFRVGDDLQTDLLMQKQLTWGNQRFNP